MLVRSLDKVIEHSALIAMSFCAGSVSQPLLFVTFVRNGQQNDVGILTKKKAMNGES